MNFILSSETKKDGVLTRKFRFILHWRLNCAVKIPTKVKPEVFINEINDFKGFSQATTVDATKCFYQIPLDEKSSYAAAFKVEGVGVFRFIVAPFGVASMSAVAQGLLSVPVNVDRVNKLSNGFMPKNYLTTDDVLELRTNGQPSTIGETMSSHGIDMNKDKAESGPSVIFNGWSLDLERSELALKSTNASKLKSRILNFELNKSFVNLQALLGMIEFPAQVSREGKAQTFYLYDLLNRWRRKVEEGALGPDEKVSSIHVKAKEELSWWNSAADKPLVNFSKPRPSVAMQHMFSDASKSKCAVVLWEDGVKKTHTWNVPAGYFNFSKYKLYSEIINQNHPF